LLTKLLSRSLREQLPLVFFIGLSLQTGDRCITYSANLAWSAASWHRRSRQSDRQWVFSRTADYCLGRERSDIGLR